MGAPAVPGLALLSRAFPWPPVFSRMSSWVPCSEVRRFSSVRLTPSGHERCHRGSAPLSPAAPQAPVFPRACHHLLGLWGHRIGRKNVEWRQGRPRG